MRYFLYLITILSISVYASTVPSISTPVVGAEVNSEADTEVDKEERQLTSGSQDTEVSFSFLAHPDSFSPINISDKLDFVLLGNESHPQSSSNTQSGVSSMANAVNEWITSGYEDKEAIDQIFLARNQTATRINDALMEKVPQICLSESLREEISQTESSLEWFSAHIREYTSKGPFRFRALEMQGADLEKQITEIGRAAKRLAPCKTDLLVMYASAKNMFEAMVGSIELLRHYSTVESAENILIYRMVDLHIRALALFDAHGNADTSDPMYAQKVSSYLENMSKWEARFVDLEEVPYGKTVFFYKRADMVKALLTPLVKHTHPWALQVELAKNE